MFSRGPKCNPHAQLIVLQTAWTWSQLQHANIAPFLGIVEFGTLLHFGRRSMAQLGLITPWMPEGNIMQYLASNVTSNKLSLLSQVADGLAYLHSQEPAIVHGGLRGNNILIELRNGRPVPLIRDFGHRRAEQQLYEHLEDTVYILPLGDPRWLAVERMFPWEYDLMLDESSDSTASDVFELLRTVLEVLSGTAPFAPRPATPRTAELVRQGILPDRPQDCSDLDDDLWRLMKRGWHSKRQERPSLDEVRAFFQTRTTILADIETSAVGSMPSFPIRPSGELDSDRVELPGGSWFNLSDWCKTS